MELLIHIVLMAITITAAVYIAIKYDEYEKYIICYFDNKIPSLVHDPVDGEWEYLRKHRGFKYVYAKEMEKDEDGSTLCLFEYSCKGAYYERCA